MTLCAFIPPLGRVASTSTSSLSPCDATAEQKAIILFRAVTRVSDSDWGHDATRKGCLVHDRKWNTWHRKSLYHLKSTMQNVASLVVNKCNPQKKRVLLWCILRCIQCHVNHMTLDAPNQNNRHVLLCVGLKHETWRLEWTEVSDGAALSPWYPRPAQSCCRRWRSRRRRRRAGRRSTECSPPARKLKNVRLMILYKKVDTRSMVNKKHLRLFQFFF